MMESPGSSVALNLPSRSTIHSSPCGTMRTPLPMVTAAKISIAMTTISKPIALSPPGVLRTLNPADLQDIALDIRHPYALADLDLLVGDRFPHFRAEYRLLKADLSLVKGTH